MAHRRGSRLPVVGLSANVLDTRLTSGRVDGIGTYTLALERSLAELGVTTRRIGMPDRRGFKFVRPTSSDIEFRLPLGLSVAATAVTGLATPFASRIEDAIGLYHSTN